MREYPIKGRKLCIECGGLFLEEEIMLSGLCARCSFDLIDIFRELPEKVTERIHNIQKREHNPQCFNTGQKSTCNQLHCEWQSICDAQVKAKIREEIV